MEVIKDQSLFETIAEATRPQMFMIGSSRGMEPIQATPQLSRGAKLIFNGPCNCEEQGCILSMEGQDAKVVIRSGDGATISDRQSLIRPWSKKFGIGLYYVDPVEIMPEEEIQRLEHLAASTAVIKAIEAQEEEKRKEAEEQALLKEYSYLSTDPGDKTHTAHVASNLRKLLTLKFPNTKFSVTKDGYDCINVRWEDGESADNVNKICYLFNHGKSSHCGDFTDIESTVFTRLFGGVKFLFTRHGLSAEAQKKIIDAGIVESEFNRYAYNEFKHSNSFYKGFEVKRSEEDGKYYTVCPEIVKKAAQIVSNEVFNINDINVQDYSEKSIAVFGEGTKAIKEKLKELAEGRASWNRYINGGSWVMPIRYKQAVLDFLKSNIPLGLTPQG